MVFTEELLQFVWQFRLYGNRLFTATGEALIVIHPGMLNRNAGPDFSNAKLKIGGTEWAGNVEIHIKSSDWDAHRHHCDPAYDNVILHVVFEDDGPIYRNDGTCMPVLILKDLFPETLIHTYEELIQRINNFPCEQQIGNVDTFTVHHFLSRLGIERLVYKTSEIEAALVQAKGDWDAVFYYFLARNFGFKVNAVPMEMLANATPHQLFARHREHPHQIEALIFGQAGFLHQKFADQYPRELKKEYLYLKKKYALRPIDVSLWKFLRMRPQNFPTLRLAQFAALLASRQQLFSKLLDLEHGTDMMDLFARLPINPYWRTHYHFHRAAAHVDVQLGTASIQNILINTFGLFLFAYGKIMDQYQYIQKAVTLLESLPKENNAIVTQYAKAGVIFQHALDSQALLQLRKKYCNEKKCLNCGIGAAILAKGIAK